MAELGTLEELPVEYRENLNAKNLQALWPNLRALLPHGKPARKSEPILWRYDDIRPLLLQAGELTPIEKAERRVLALSNPGLGLENMMATPSIYIGMQLIQPGETAPCHKHTPSAIRCVVEGSGGFTTVEGEKCPMEKGDLILTPADTWHEHGHEGSGPVIWMDALDLPLVYYLEASYAIEGPSQPLRNAPDSSQTRYRRAGLVPYQSLGSARAAYPLYRYPWVEVRESLLALATDTAASDPVWLAYVNPETGKECLPILGFSALMLRPGETLNLTRRSASAVMHIIEGVGEAEIDGITLGFGENDTFAIPTHATVKIANGSSKTPAFVFVVDDAPLQRKLAFYEEFPAT
ncbi:MAG: cupin domain-containing protein [Alphaproteobacteria bacterium]|jgi:gentisate 1,2-dioxygenase